jgi:hypothetical protein
MDLRESLHIWRRRWILTVTLLLLASVGVAAAAKSLRTYQAESQVVLLASRSVSRLNGGNPYLSFNGSLTLTADALSRAVTAPTVTQDLAARGYVSSYTVALATYTTTTTGSVLVVTVTGRHKLGVEGTLRAVTKEVSAQLANLQRGIPPRNQVHAATLSYWPQAGLSVGQTAHSVLPLVALALLVAFGLPVIIDGWVLRLRMRRQRRAVSGDDAPYHTQDRAGVTQDRAGVADPLAYSRFGGGDDQETMA